MSVTIPFTHSKMEAQEKATQPFWQRLLLLIILGYEAAGCISGGSLMVLAPDGRYMEMPVQMMHGFFPDFLIPGILLLALGVLTTSAFIAILRRWTSGWLLACFALLALLIWFWIEVAILQELVWLHALWGLPVVLGAVMTIPLIPDWRSRMRKAGLFCGILSSVLYVAINIIVPDQYPGYSLAAHTPSELSAIGAPTRMLWSVLATPYTFLMIAFAWGVWKSAGTNRNLRIAGFAMWAYASLGFLWPFAPMHQRDVIATGGGTFTDTLHLALGGATEVFYLIALGFAAFALGKGFRIYSLITFIFLMFFGMLTFLDAPKLSMGEPTPMIGVWERLNIGLFLVWVIVLATILWEKAKTTQDQTSR